MRAGGTIRTARDEAGIALLIAIFVLLLISVVAIALIVSSGTETALAGNYRSSTSVYYAALAGLEEARSRLSPKDPNSFKTSWTSFYPSPGTTLPIGTVGYVLNPGPGEAAGSLLTTYPDNQYVAEFGVAPATVKPPTLSIWNKTPLSNLSFPGPSYKWVRINAVSEKSLQLQDSYPFDGTQDTTPLFYDGTHLTDVPGSGSQVFEVTALAVLPNASGQSSQKLVQYLTAPAPINMPVFPAALTLAAGTGHSVAFTAPDSNPSYYVSGNDIAVPELPSCTPGAPVDAIATYHTLEISDVIYGYAGFPTSGIPGFMRPSYTGAQSAPDVSRDPIANFQTPSQLNALVQSIVQGADAFVPPGNAATQTAYMTSLGMSASNMMTVVSNGDLDLSHWGNTGYGLLLVTGNYTFDPDNGWRGIILVIGKGTINNTDNTGNREIDGAVFVANTLDPSNLGTVSVRFLDGMQGNGIRYSSCWIQAATPKPSYKILSFHEIAQ